MDYRPQFGKHHLVKGLYIISNSICAWRGAGVGVGGSIAHSSREIYDEHHN